MKFIKYIALFALVLSASGFSSSTKKGELENSLLWKIEGKNIQTSYLFGTIHLMPKAKFTMPERVKTAFGKCAALILEIDISDMSAAQDIVQISQLPEGVTLQSLLSDEEYKQLDSALMATTGMGLALLNNYKPIVVESMLLQNMVGEDAVSFEMEFLSMAQAQEKPIVGLETPAQQMMFFDELPYEEQVKDLMNYARGTEDMTELFDKMVSVYLAENLNELNVFMNDYYPDLAWLDVLLYQRNAAWIPKIESAAEAQSVFIAVGAGHLAGDQGVINLLRQSGYNVTAVK